MQRKLSSRPESGFWTRTRKNVSAESDDESGVYAGNAARSLLSRDGRRRPPLHKPGVLSGPRALFKSISRPVYVCFFVTAASI
jgi:hypothetical protein